jgi:hypothetical protein
MWNPIDDIGDFIGDTVDAVKQVIKSGGVRNATRDVANRAATSGAGGGYAAPARSMASQAALRAYEKQSKAYKDIALLADALLTGGVSDPIARAGAARVSGNSAAQRKALEDLAITGAINLASAGVGKAVSKGAEVGLNALAKRKALEELSNIIGFHHSWTPGLSVINPSVVQTGKVAATAADQIPGYAYLWAGDFPSKGIDTASGLPWREIASRFMGDINQTELVKLMAMNGVPQPTDAAGFIQRIRPFEQSAIGEVPYQFLKKVENWMPPSPYDEGYTYIVKAPAKTLSMDENLFTQSGINLFEKFMPATSLKNKGPLEVLDEIPTGPLNPGLRFAGMDPNALLDSYINQVLLQKGRASNIIAKGAQQARQVDSNTDAISLLARAFPGLIAINNR